METARAVPSKMFSPKPKNSPTLFIGRLSEEFVFQYLKYSHGSLASAKTILISKKNATAVEYLQDGESESAFLGDNQSVF